MELATLTSKGQITIPVKIRNKMNLKAGDKVFFIEDNEKIIVQNASQIALVNIQNSMNGKAKQAGFKSEEDIAAYIKKIRSQN